MYLLSVFIDIFLARETILNPYYALLVASGVRSDARVTGAWGCCSLGEAALVVAPIFRVFRACVF